MAVGTGESLPTYRDLIYPTLKAVAALGGSGQSGEIAAQLISDLGVTDEQLAITYEGREKSVIVDRMAEQAKR